jgi:hypothetical protein
MESARSNKVSQEDHVRTEVSYISSPAPVHILIWHLLLSTHQDALETV